jgi:hypothetical protein
MKRHRPKSAGVISPLMYGPLTEEINHSYDGGFYAELIRNRSFLTAHSITVATLTTH